MAGLEIWGSVPLGIAIRLTWLLISLVTLISVYTLVNEEAPFRQVISRTAAGTAFVVAYLTYLQ